MSSGEEITEFAENLRGLKDRAGRSYGMLAARLHVSTSTLHRYCNGDAVPAEYAAVERFARLCEATPEELIALHRRWILADAARRSASGRGGTGRATAPDGASGHAAARRGPAAQAVGTPGPAGRVVGPPAPATQAAGAREAAGSTADAREAGQAADPRHHATQAARTPDPAGQADTQQNAAGLAADHHDAAGQAAAAGGDEGRLSAAGTRGEPCGAERAGAADGPADGPAMPAGRRDPSSPTAADSSRARRSDAGDAVGDATVGTDASRGCTAVAFAAEGAADVGRDEPGETPHPLAPADHPLGEGTPRDRTNAALTANGAAAGESAGGVGPGAAAREGDDPSVERRRSGVDGGRRAEGDDAARTDRQGGRVAPDGPGGRATGTAGRTRGAAGRGPLRPVPAADDAGRRPVGLRALRSRPWGLMLGAAAAAVLALTAVEVRSTTGGEREEAATSPSSPASPAPSASGTAPSARPTARGELKKDDSAAGRESASPGGGGRRGGASASASPRQGGSSDGGSGGGRDDKPGSGTPLTVSTRSHVWENGCDHRYLINRSPSQVAPPPVEQDAAAWASAHGAVHGGTTNVEMTVKGRSESAVVLQALHVRVVGRRTPLPWTSFAMENGCGGSLTPRAFSVNLDAARPLAVPTDGNDAGEPIPAVRFPYRVSDTDPEVLLVNARTSGCACSWYLELDWTSGDREGTIRIDDHGAPFRTSGVKGRPEYGYQFEEQVWRRND
ncbi:helix-turn-helix domain-containing protein [Streptomyces sp. ME19-01-6]|uniref:helix-turn-helix domain-containing protein n=1 Tax=Streptomyces sp. ME19-01-6 TaxID=3028686 RepID=UPI0029BB8467|nr:helix-turn-helix domain-containing protein [Streptomyces sp. ME19-01-6]MDX3232413.1 helix-turn-helix domain-containing protein [Streptomyces sp. ME19-01-6]